MPNSLSPVCSPTFSQVRTRFVSEIHRGAGRQVGLHVSKLTSANSMRMSRQFSLAVRTVADAFPNESVLSKNQIDACIING